MKVKKYEGLSAGGSSMSDSSDWGQGGSWPPWLLYEVLLDGQCRSCGITK